VIYAFKLSVFLHYCGVGMYSRSHTWTLFALATACLTIWSEVSGQSINAVSEQVVSETASKEGSKPSVDITSLPDPTDHGIDQGKTPRDDIMLL